MFVAKCQILACIVHGCYYFVVRCEWLVFFSTTLLMVAVISWCTVDGFSDISSGTLDCCPYFPVHLGYVVLCRGALQKVASLSQCTLDGCSFFKVHSRSLLFFHGAL